MTKANNQLRKFVPSIPDPQCAAIDAFGVQCVVRPSVLCISSLQSDHEMCAKDKRSEGENPASNPGMAIRTLVPPPVSSPIRSTPTPSEFRDYATSPIQPEDLVAPTEHKQVDFSCLAASLNTKLLRGCPKSYSPHCAQELNLSVNPVWRSGMAGV